MTLFGRLITVLVCLFILSALAYGMVTATRETLMPVVAVGVVVALFLTIHLLKGWWDERREITIGRRGPLMVNLSDHPHEVNRFGRSR